MLLSSVVHVPNLTKCLVLNYEPCMFRPTIVDMNPVERKYYTFMISLNKCNGSCNVFSPKIYVPKDINAKTFDMITKKDEAKAITEHIWCDCKCKFNSTTCNSKQKCNNKTCKCECKNYHKCKENCSLNPSTCICGNSKYLKSFADNSVTECDENLIDMDIVSTKKRNTIATNFTSTASIGFHSKNVRPCYVLHAVLLITIKLLIAVSICCYPRKYQTKHFLPFHK